MSASLREILLPSQEKTLVNLAEELRKKDKLAARLSVDPNQFSSLGELETLEILRERPESKPFLRDGRTERQASQKLACCWP
jgi:hypothetical protein